MKLIFFNLLLLFYIALLLYILNRYTYTTNYKLSSNYKYIKYNIGYYPNNVTGLFTKLIGLASVVGLCILKNNHLLCKYYIYTYA